MNTAITDKVFNAGINQLLLFYPIQPTKSFRYYADFKAAALTGYFERIVLDVLADAVSDFIYQNLSPVYARP